MTVKPRLQNFPSQSLRVGTSSKRPPPVSNCDHFLGLMVNDFPLFFTSCKRPLHAFSGLYFRCVHYVEGDMGAYSIVLYCSICSVFFKRYFSNFDFKVRDRCRCRIEVSFSPAVCGFSSFWLTVFSKRRFVTVLWYCSLHYPV